MPRQHPRPGERHAAKVKAEQEAGLSKVLPVMPYGTIPGDRNPNRTKPPRLPDHVKRPMRQLIILALLMASTASAAPAPRPSARKVPPVTAGAYVLNWGGCDWPTALREDGTYESVSGNTVYATKRFRGHWWYSPRTHTLCIWETGDSNWDHQASWEIKLDADWAAQVGQIKAKLRRVGR